MEQKIDNAVLLERLKNLCSQKGISLTAAFTESGVGKNFKSNLKYANASIGKVTMLANYFGVSVDYLLGKEESNEQPEPIKEKNTPAKDGLDEYEKKLIGTFRKTTIEGKIRILNAADEITKEIEKNHTGSDSSFA